MAFTPLLEDLIDALRCLPGVGQKSAQRMAFQLLERGREGGWALSRTLAAALEKIGRCETCQNFSETPQCPLCQDASRETDIMCVVESPADVMAIEQARDYRGQYFVLMGHLSPIDGIGPEEIGVDKLLQRVTREGTRELIIATNPTVEGETTAHYIADRLADNGVLITRLAQGIPVGGELGYIDGSTLVHAFTGRKPLAG
ncbi:recombination mediator RecR [Hydrocarboniclastica marina]|uniref:Recombination protein RecR n=1 Tax=Hydrocarboniclastica marina TaxID=2259620 RepID=A0A4P7XHV7_9ALTE|nr:recombination mediator RecR [Hydrocarboniclastica marina]MAL97848.1 recombination protein RecR [Alteromonadaceae bacterium]QCF26263.1 recombination protein RecR [Hydrocarboniclastica marina]